jgi:hypothetical protein
MARPGPAKGTNKAAGRKGGKSRPSLKRGRRKKNARHGKVKGKR